MTDFFARKDPDPEDFVINEEEFPEAEETPGALTDGFSPAQHSSQFYPFFRMQHLYYTDNGVDMIPVAGPANAAVHARPVRRHAPMTKKAVFWEVGRLTLRPVLPDPDTSEANPNEVLLKMLIIAHTPQLQPGGQVYFWRVEGVYIYGLFAAPRAGDAYYAGCSPCSMDQAEALRVEGFQFSKDLLLSTAPQDYNAALAKVIS